MRRERMVDDREPVARFCALDLPDDAQPAELDLLTAFGLNADPVDLGAHAISFG
jgi:hypothetical protein